MATTDLGEIRMLPLSAVHPDPRNPRTELRGLDKLAREMKLIGQQDPISVYEHPDIEGAYQILGGHRRYQAALRGDMGQIMCRIAPAPENPAAEIYAEALTTGTNHSTLTSEEQGLAIQGLLTEGKSETWIARNFNVKKAEVKVRAGFASKPKLAARFDSGKLDLLAMAKLQDFEEKTGDTQLVEKVTAQVAESRTWSALEADDVERIIANEVRRSARETEGARLTGLGGEELADEHRYSGRYEITEAELTDEEHIAAGHLYSIEAGGTEWWAKISKPKKALTEEQKAEKELVRTLNNNLGATRRARRVFTIGKIQDKTALKDAEDRGIMTAIIFDGDHFNEAAAEIIGEVISLPYPQPEDDESEYSAAVTEKREQWKDKALQLVTKLALGQQVRLFAACQAARVEEQAWRTNLYVRGSWEKETTWQTMRKWYNRLISYFGYIPDEYETAAIRWGAKDAGREVDVLLPDQEGLEPCESCGTVPFEPTGATVCTGCQQAGGAEGEVAS